MIATPQRAGAFAAGLAAWAGMMVATVAAAPEHGAAAGQSLQAGSAIRSMASGAWSDAKVWQPARVPGAGDRVTVSAGTRVTYDVKSVGAEVTDVAWPKLLDPAGDLPPATIVTSVRSDGGKLVVRGVSHDNGKIVRVTVNGREASVVGASSGVADWQVVLDGPAPKELVAGACDEAGNVEQTPHVYRPAASPAHHGH
ncbi:MAG: hypothetical protein ACAI43_20810 [Phycisphaerae bacterium]